MDNKWNVLDKYYDNNKYYISNVQLESFNDFINQINDNFSHEQKLEMISFLWQTAYADNVLDVDEERLIRRIADMIRVKDMQVLKLKHQAKRS